MVTVAAMASMILAVILVVARVTQGRIDASLERPLAATEAATARAGDGSLQVTDTAANEVIDSVWVFDARRHPGVRTAGRQPVQSIVESLSRVTAPTRLSSATGSTSPARSGCAASGGAGASRSPRSRRRAYEDTQTVLVVRVWPSWGSWYRG